MTTRVLVAGEICVYREGIAAHLERLATVTVAGAATCAAETVERINQLAPDVVLLDMAMAESLDVLRAVATHYPGVRVVALSVPDRESEIMACAEAGVAGFVTRDASLADLVRTIEAAARDECVVSPRVAAGLLRRVATLASEQGARKEPAVDLTAREIDIVRCIERGLSNKEIAARLTIEVATVKNHVHNVLDKLHVHRRGEIARWVRHAFHWLPPARDDLDLSLHRS